MSAISGIATNGPVGVLALIGLYVVMLAVIFVAACAVGFVASWFVDCIECRRQVRSQQWRRDVRERG